MADLSPARVDTLVWLLIYGGMILFAIGASIAREDAVFGWGLAGTGAVATLAGLALIVVRSRMKRRP